ncbi:tetraacyldisaccharide 4'-kinase [Komagataeibacter nataicola]|uniref:Tetraacyldisaccharide 4'-kinase n=1 Tax=Komagataeibacter nataicola TaxID=265960 RepID=A0A9N7CJT0_9PROT|nr:tetraacyldisaccharide 4'-kinase [Komagataeibacter nataicola]AQU86543.1 tetraacyldisaccharide 4'-kinase [Komagataeibacter nataicola]PYD66346.1 tetraacyldisaccharide 4'-kinase [Komagataeibacter nataicola]WEQ56563.1 tetraacyldisaccharide 4'-kinase [Komagataeibacter nataicola]WNM08059.1 tetraacyldisaccharide 4'-kinase [Komagataeibacter nataicola]GBR22126.1 tetraacyldisaccharide 4'-kinase [Komagataeibacter nataicola NRIC 0616]
MQPPAFWWRPATDAGLMAGLLAPLAHIYAAATARRLNRTSWHAPVPVLCCGNIGVGGAGKTPLVMDMAQRALSRGRRPAFLSRGYGGRARMGTRVDPNHHTARDVGDEPLLLARIAPCYVGTDRAVSARRALADGADCLLMDDGFQNPTLHQDLALVVVDGAVGFGNGRVLPAGPLREPVATALARAGGMVVMGHDRQGIKASLPDGLPCFAATLQPDTQAIPPDRPIIAFAGIGRPGKFFEGLAQCGIHPARCLAFPDHHAYTAAEQARLHRLAVQAGACLVTTQKDAVRLDAALRAQVRTVGLQLAWATPAMPERILDLWLGTIQQ